MLRVPKEQIEDQLGNHLMDVLRDDLREQLLSPAIERLEYALWHSLSDGLWDELGYYLRFQIEDYS